MSVTPTSPNHPQVEYAPLVDPLPHAAEAVLVDLGAGYQRVIVAQELGGGYTDSRVLVIHRVRSDGKGALPLVVKLGPTWLIEREKIAYRRIIRDKLAGRIELIRTAENDTWAALAYRLAGDGQFKHESLSQFYHQADTNRLVEVLETRLFKRLETLWRDAKPRPYTAAKYDLLLPVHLVIRPQSLPDEGASHHLTPEHAAEMQLKSGAWVRVEGFVVTEIDVERRQVTVNLPPTAGRPPRSHRLRIIETDLVETLQVNQTLPPLNGVVVLTRREQLEREFDKVQQPNFPVKINRSTLYLPDGRSLPNPLAYLPELLRNWPPVNLGDQHGDLNLENILVDPATGDVTLIDFANATDDHVLHDLLHLETNVLIDLLPQILAEMGDTPDVLCSLLYDQLHRAATEDSAWFSPPPLLHPALQKLYALLVAIRRAARPYLQDPHRWDEYYRGLALHLLGALKYKNLDDSPSAPLPKQVALVGAAAAVALWQHQSLPAESPIRVTRLEAQLRAALPADLAGDQPLEFNGVSLANPMNQLAHLLPVWLAGDFRRLHGQFDVDAMAHRLADDAFIEQTLGPDQRLHHWLRVEATVVARLLPPALDEALLSPEIIHFQFYERLHRAGRGDTAQFALPKPLPAPLHQAYQRLSKIRRAAAAYLPTPADWADYYRGLALYLLSLLHRPNDTSRSDSETQVIFLAAAIATDLWLKPNARPQPPPPYKGLHAFQEEDAPFFFGRETFVGNLAQTVQTQPLVAFSGPSGSGKSSLVRAGLIPRLGQDGEWVIITMRPGSAPLDELARNLTLATGQPAEPLAKALHEGHTGLTDLIKHPDMAKRLLLIVDQFEELYTLCSNPDLRRRFIDVLLAAMPPAGETSASLHILLTLRADFLGKALDYPPLAMVLQSGPQLLGAMAPPELEQVIEYPAETLGFIFEPGLVDQILADVDQEPGQLPLLEFALTLLWQQQQAGRLTRRAYEAIGRVSGAVTHYAEQVYAGFSPEQQSQTRRVLTQLVQPGAGTEDTRRIAARSDLNVDWALVQQLADARLVVTNRSAAKVETVEIVHEALIQNWERLRSWMDEDREFRTWQERLRAALNQWQTTGLEEGGLLRGAPLVQAEEWLTQREADLSAVERDFILRSITLRQQQAAQIEADRQRQLRQAQTLAETERRRAEEQSEAASKLRRRAIALGTALVMLLLAILGVGIFFQFWTTTEALLTVAEVKATEADMRRATALSAAQAAEYRQSTAEWSAQAAQTAEAQAVMAEATAVYAKENADVDRQAALNAEQTAVAARHVAQTQQARAEQNEGQAVIAQQTALAEQATAESAEAVAQQAAQTARANQATAQALQIESETAAEAARQAQALAEANRLAAEQARQAAEQAKKAAEAAQRDAEQRASDALTEAEKLERLNTSRQLAAQALTLLPEDPTLAFLLVAEANRITETTEARDVLLTALQTYPRLNYRLHDHTGPVESMAMAPKRQLLASAGADSTIILWQMQADGPPQRIGQPLTGHNGTIKSLAFNSAQGEILVSGSDNGEIIVWDVSDPQRPRKMGNVIQDGGVNTLAFNSGGKILASGSSYGEIILWLVQPGQPLQALGTFAGHNGSVEDVAFRPYEKMLVSAGEDRKLRLWDVQNPQQPQQLWQSDDDDHKNWVWSVAFSPDGQMLASGDGDGTINLWDVEDARQPQRLDQFLQAHSDDVFSLAFSSDGNNLASGSGDNTIILWSLQNFQQTFSLHQTLTGHTNRVTSLAFYPDKEVLISASGDGTLISWGVEQDQLLQFLGRRLVGHDRQVNSVAFSPDKKTLASAGNEGIIILWDVQNFRQPVELAKLGVKFIGVMTSVVFSPDGKTLAAGKSDGSILLWDVQNRSQPQPLGQPLTEHASNIENLIFTSDGLTLASISSDGTIILWDMQDRQQPQSLGLLLSRPSSTFKSIAFSPDRTILAAGKSDGSIILWDIQNRSQPQPLGPPLIEHSSVVESLHFSQDGQTLVSGSADKSIVLWDMENRQQPRRLGQPLRDHNSSLQSVIFSPDGKTLVSGGDDSYIVLWDVQDRSQPQPLGQPLKGHILNVITVAFNPNNQIFASGSLNNSNNLILWEVGSEPWRIRACQKAGRNLSQAELDRYIPEQLQVLDQDQSVCPEYPYPDSEITLTKSALEAKHSTAALATTNPAFSPTRSIIPGPVDTSPMRLYPVPLTCNSPRLWTTGLTYSAKQDPPEEVVIKLPLDDLPLELWLLTTNPEIPPKVEQAPAQQIVNDDDNAVWWSYSLTPEMATNGEITIYTSPLSQLVNLLLCSPNRSSLADKPNFPEGIDQTNVSYLPLITKR
ncbi:MAG: hypothetical protein H6631_18790 [Anaerolineaceae bacterium]|nr:hypothetical protein [Anaerolineaceae bacterium]